MSLAILAPAPAKAVSGFTGTFDQSTWTVVNTQPSQTLSGANGICNTSAGYGSNDNNVGCTSPTYLGNVTITGTETGSTPTIDLAVDNTTNVVLTNTNWRPYIISFNWQFDYTGDTQYVTFTTDPGTVIVDGIDHGYTWSSNSVDYPSSTASIYLPPGATLSFSVTTDNNSGFPSLAISSFDAVEIPAPLPLAGASSAFLWSRRLRRRRQPAGQQHSLSLAGQARHSASQPALLPPKRQAVERYAELIGRPLQSSSAPLGQLPPRACNAPVSKSNSR
jgi:hypothetical protein